MSFEDQLRLLRDAEGDPAKLALTTVDLAYPDLPEAERLALKGALEAAAIPHWCDAAILAALLEIPNPEAEGQLARLKGLKTLEQFPARDAVNVHEATRLVLRKRMAADRQDRFRELSQRAAACFAHDDAPAARIEWIYHRLCAEPEAAANELRDLSRDWTGGRLEDDYAMEAALTELADTNLVQGRARLWVLLCTAWSRAGRGEITQLADVAREILDIAQSTADARATADANALLGDVLRAQGNLVDAEGAYRKYLSISRRLAAQDPSDADAQRDLAVANSRVGITLEMRGKLADAQAAFEEDRSICERLVELDPSNAGWQSDHAVAYSRIGDILRRQGQLEDAERAYRKYQQTFRRLVAQDATNANWRRELAVAHGRVGGLLQARGHLAEAEAELRETLRISLELAKEDPSDVSKQSDLAVAHSQLGDALAAQRKLAEAEAAFEESLSISRRLAKQAPDNAILQRDLAVAGWWFADQMTKVGRHDSALPLYEEASRILEVLVADSPEMAQWASDKKNVDSDLAACRARVGTADESTSN